MIPIMSSTFSGADSPGNAAKYSGSLWHPPVHRHTVCPRKGTAALPDGRSDCQGGCHLPVNLKCWLDFGVKPRDPRYGGATDAYVAFREVLSRKCSPAGGGT